MRLALIKNGVVDNVIAVSAENMTETMVAMAHLGYFCVQSDTAGPGDQYDDATGGFIRQEDPPVEQRHISVGAFYDRFGEHKMEILASTNPVAQALIKDASVRRYIDLDRPDLRIGLELLVQVGFAIDPDAVVNAPVAPHELPYN